MAEMQSEVHATGMELARQMEMTAVMRMRMEEAEAMAAEAQRKVRGAARGRSSVGHCAVKRYFPSKEYRIRYSQMKVHCICVTKQARTPY